MLLMDIFYSPEQPPIMISSQRLYNNVSILMANYEDCNLYLSGARNADTDHIDQHDTFIVGNFDLAEATTYMMNLYAESGNITDFAACGVFQDCPVVSDDS